MEFISKYLVELILGIIVSYLGFVYNKIKKYLKKVEDYQNVVRDILEEDIIKQLKEEKDSLESKEKILKLYKKYKRLDGNNIDEKIINSLYGFNGRCDK